ncbi:MAG: dihydrodipicolinate synthase family protein [Planctomycetaceae bacterium]|nr:dihydrodipicolinate synthase family protein [Planctomycetaceae bacterium]
MMKPQEFKSKLKGIVHLALTPFDTDGNVDVPALKESVRMVTQNPLLKGEDVVFLAMGTTGEFYAMNESENRQVIDVVTQEVNGTFPVMIGSARAGTRYTIEMSKYAQSAGADGLLIVHPYYAMPTLDGVMRHYAAIADAVDIGICIYNNPTTSKLWLNAQQLRKLSQIDTIVGLKENTNNPMAFLNILQTLDPNDIATFAGLGHFMYQFMCFSGCGGFVTELLNYAPHLAVDLYHAGKAKDADRVRAVCDRIMLFWNWVFALAAKNSPIPSVLTPGQTPSDMPFYQAANKAAAKLCGMPCGTTREPMENIPETELPGLRKILEQMGCAVV